MDVEITEGLAQRVRELAALRDRSPDWLVRAAVNSSFPSPRELMHCGIAAMTLRQS